MATNLPQPSSKVKLQCGVYGEGTVFSVEIERNADVEALQKAIVNEKKDVNHRFNVDPATLTLYLARKNGAWLTGGQSVKNLLREAVDKEYQEMYSWWKLDDKEVFGKAFEPGNREIQVLVELGASGVATETSATTKMIKDIHDQLVQSKRKRYVHSNVGSRSSKGRELLQDLNIHVKPVRTIPFRAGDHIPADAFEWESVRDGCGQNIALTEEQQRVRYRAYVEENIGGVLAEKELCVVGVEKGQDILSVLVPGRDIELAGRTDLLILSDVVKEDPLNLQFLPGVKMLIEVKRAVKPGSVFQALSELIALDLLVTDPVMAVLTDLTNNWQFFWVSEMCDTHINIHKATITEPGEAFGVIRTVLAQESNVDTDVHLPCVGEPVKRRKLAKMLPTIGETGESGSIRAAIERYYDIASVLGPDIDMARAAANQIVRTIPMFSYYT